MIRTATCGACHATFHEELTPLVPGVPEDGFYQESEFCPECEDEIEQYCDGDPELLTSGLQYVGNYDEVDD